MSMWPAPAAGQDLYTASTSKRMSLGTIHNFDTDGGIVTAMYCQNNNTASVAAGLLVGLGANGWGFCDTAAVAPATVQDNIVIGGLAASMAASSTGTASTAGGFGWVILHGPQTNVFLGATLASSAAARGLVHSSNAMLSTGVTTQNTTTGAQNLAALAILRSFSTTLTSGTGHGAIADWLWR